LVTYTLHSIPDNNRIRIDSFNIMAPEAFHGATFEEYSCSDTWAILSRTALNIRY
jgi:hypothetical protein